MEFYLFSMQVFTYNACRRIKHGAALKKKKTNFCGITLPREIWVKNRSKV